MNDLTVSIISNAVWELLKKGVKISIEYLREKLSNWILSDNQLEKIKNTVNTVPTEYMKSEGLLREYLALDDNLIELLSNAKTSEISVEQEFEKNYGVAVGVMNGGVINNYSNFNEPLQTQGKSLIITDKFTQYRPIQLVKSFSHTRENCIVEGGEHKYVYADIIIPNSVREKEGCQFEMMLFAFVPSENYTNFCDENYALSFELITSSNIKKVQLQIKDTHQHQFVDLPVNKGIFKCLLKELADRKCWSDVLELCFTIFADEEYIVGDLGYIKIIDLKLTK